MMFECWKRFDEWSDKHYEWHKWYAWYPVGVETHDCRWLEGIERCRKVYYGPHGSLSYWTYRVSTEQ